MVELVTCPKCGSTNVTFVATNEGHLTFFGDWIGTTRVYQCQCRLAFTKTDLTTKTN